MWDELVHGAIGAVVLVDTRRLADCFPAVDFFENRDLPYILALNCFDGIQRHHANDVRDAMSVSEAIPIVTCDARQRESTKQTLISLVEYVVQLRTRVRVSPRT
jgi:signal recognition particle receptor subunit beta